MTGLTASSSHEAEVSVSPAADGTRLEEHFGFGANWRRFLSVLDEQRIAEAERSLRNMLDLGEGPSPLADQRFLDAGSGSGLFSLAASRLGADVVSFDFDPESVACTRELKSRFGREATGRWEISEGSVLDESFLRSLGTFNIVYSWGVLHHTGAMWTALANVTHCVTPGGRLFIAIYNDQARLSELWAAIKSVYQRLPPFLRSPYAVTVGAVYFSGKAVAKAALWPVRFLGQSSVRRAESGERLRLARSGDRGMSRWYDLIDWVGGYPFEVATADELVDFLSRDGFFVERMRTVGGRMGCNEILFRRHVTGNLQ